MIGKKTLIFWLPIVFIIIAATAGYGLIYSNNPYMELFSLSKTLMGQSIIGQPAPDFSGITAWINSPSLSVADLSGQVVLVDFWTYSCINCQRDAPYVVAWDKKYRDAGLVIVGVHTPEFRFEQKLENVQAAVKQHGIEYPVALDNDYQTWQAYGNHYWPAKYLIDKTGQVVYARYGEGAYEEFETKIQELLAQ